MTRLGHNVDRNFLWASVMTYFFIYLEEIPGGQYQNFHFHNADFQKQSGMNCGIPQTLAMIQLRLCLSNYLILFLYY